MSMRERAKAASYRLFATGDRLGVHVLPSHYYSSLPSWKWLKGNEAKWRRPTTMAGIPWDVDAQVAWMEAQVGSHASELPRAQLEVDAESVGGLRFGPIEAQMLYGVLRTRNPRRVVEIGSGSSTMVMSQAAVRNVAEGGRPMDIVAIDPYTAGRVAHLPHVTARDDHGIDLRAADLDLTAGDLLFIDSTHAVRTGSEVPHLYLDLLPSLPAGVLVHIHDIYLPYLFTPDLYSTYFDWQETTLLAALLVGNASLQVRCCMSALHHARPDALLGTFPEYRPLNTVDGLAVGDRDAGDFPASIWIETV